MTHAQIVAALRNDVETHRDVYSISRSRQLCVADGRSGGRESSTVESVVRHGARPEESPATTERAGRLTTCVCGHIEGDHHGVVRGPLRPPLLGRCLVTGCDCEIFTENVLRPVPGTGGRRHV